MFALACLVLGFGAGQYWADRSESPGVADVGFYDDMSTHHMQAIAMARIYLAARQRRRAAKRSPATSTSASPATSA